ncbi:MAG: peptidoglycan peptidase [Paracoccus sp. (in: a-proteobacteria)]|uniref:peptidoglycan peptidase n=1 Tax=Paracoccus sp. TaxID=267 RepID=UPI0026DEFEE6|nr:peptidoglycan peptidase [Paracoccus sp. (in: a-proteobacteria)]MDO5631482.1 peptidoglycan peptidase [Paracoccus sp. (in: a-proteobacteria)]
MAQGDLPPGPDGTQPDYYQTLLSEAEWDWRPGDLIFLNDLNSFDELLRQTEGGKWGSVGILRPSSGDPRVVFAHEDEGVTERILYELTDTRSGDEYVVYRLKDAETPGLGLMTNYLLLSAYGSPFDQVLLFGNGRFYGAELPFEAAMSEGHVIAAPQRLGDLADMNSPLVKTILADWPAHPYCVAALSITDCWQDVQNIAIITPGALLSSNRLVRVYP